jgi:hypothetical protein
MSIRHLCMNLATYILITLIRLLAQLVSLFTDAVRHTLYALCSIPKALSYLCEVFLHEMG